MILWIITPKPLKIQNLVPESNISGNPVIGKTFKTLVAEMERAIYFQFVAAFCADESLIFVNICFKRVKILKISLRIDSYWVLKILMTYFLEFNVTFQAKIVGLGRLGAALLLPKEAETNIWCMVALDIYLHV